jgi:hypothetical protein
MRTRIGLIVLGLSITSAVRADEPAELKPLAFLVGEWDSSGSGEPGSASGIAAFRWSLQDRVMVRTNVADYPGAGGRPASRHDDLLIIYVSGTAVRADYYDSEGHVIRYSVRAPAPGQAVFLSDEVPGEPRFRLTYMLTAEGRLDGRFESADPGTAVFKPYLTWHSRKVKQAS